jgi:hypothetical protein
MSFEELLGVEELASAMMGQRCENSKFHILAVVTLKALNHIDALEEQIADLRSTAGWGYDPPLFNACKCGDEHTRMFQVGEASGVHGCEGAG